MDERTAFIHHYLNDLHEKAVWIRAQLAAQGIPARLVYEREREVMIDGARRRQSYPTPCLRINDDAEIGVNLDGVYLDFWCDRTLLDFRRTLAGLRGAFERVEAYYPGGHTAICASGRDVDAAAAAVDQSGEPIIAFSICLNHDVAHVADSFIRARDIIAEGLQNDRPQPVMRANC